MRKRERESRRLRNMKKRHRQWRRTENGAKACEGERQGMAIKHTFVTIKVSEGTLGILS